VDVERRQAVWADVAPGTAAVFARCQNLVAGGPERRAGLDEALVKQVVAAVLKQIS